MTLVDHLAGILATSGCFWALYCLYCIFSIRFIVKRYEQETDLLSTAYFAEHMPFTRYLIGFHSSGLYSMHLLLFVWGWPIVRFIKEKRPTVPYFRDIETPEEVTRHFSAKEIRRVKRAMIVLGIVILHGFAYLIFRAIWPDVFSR